ncbi:jg10111, partial [Pararge aegeria aegeria]
WRVDENVTSSDHNTIVFEIQHNRAKGILINRTTRIFNTKKANWSEFHEKLTQFINENKINKDEIEQIDNKTDLDKITASYSNTIVEVCKETIPVKKRKEVLKIPWWNEELATLKKQVATKKRRIRCAAPIRRTKVVDEYLKAKQVYEDKAKEAQTSSWKKFCDQQTKEGVWDNLYRVIGRTEIRQEDLPLAGNTGTCGPMESAKLLADTFYPEDSKKDDTVEHRRIRDAAERVNEGPNEEVMDPPFTMKELQDAAGSFNPKKAPGREGLTPDICLQAIKVDPDAYLALANKCLEIGYFPKIWKIATVVVLRKPGKEDYTNPKAYWPIGLLPVLGKILEKLIINRIKWYILPRLSTRQFGFTPQKSTEDSLYVLLQHIKNKLKEKKLITVVSLDIEGAFDSAWWPAIRVRLAEENCPKNIRKTMDSYLKDRKVCVRYAGEEYAKETTKGCVQGSIGGPILWNILLDPLLKNLENRGDHCQAFADDIVLVFHGDSGLEISLRANATLAHVRDWGVKNKLKFAPHKTKAMTITNRLKYDTPVLRMGGIDIGMSREIKILGLTIDHKLTFNKHIDETCQKV